MNARSLPILVAVTALALVFSACGTDAVESTTTTPPATETTTTMAPTTTTVPPTTAAPTTTTLPGEPFDIVFAAGSEVAVIGVAHDDVLNVRSGPGVEFDVVAELDPTSTDAIALGEGRLLVGSIWQAVEVDGVEGWVNSSFLALAGAVDDQTSAVVTLLGGIPTGSDMVELGELVADTFASTDPPSTITMVVAPTVGDLGEVTYDVVGLGDDSVRGVRLHIFGTPGDEGFGLKSVEVTTLCGRGVTEDGLCV